MFAEPVLAAILQPGGVRPGTVTCQRSLTGSSTGRSLYMTRSKCVAMAVLTVRDGLRFTLPRDPVALSAALREAEEPPMITSESPRLVKRSLRDMVCNIQAESDARWPSRCMPDGGSNSQRTTSKGFVQTKAVYCCFPFRMLPHWVEQMPCMPRLHLLLDSFSRADAPGARL